MKSSSWRVNNAFSSWSRDLQRKADLQKFVRTDGQTTADKEDEEEEEEEEKERAHTTRNQGSFF